MAKADWSHFWTPGFIGTGSQNYTFAGRTNLIAPGAGSSNIAFSTGKGASPAIAGFLYDGPTISKFPVQDGIISFAVRNGESDYIVGTSIIGGLCRFQGLYSGQYSGTDQVLGYIVGTKMAQTVFRSTTATAIYKLVGSSSATLVADALAVSTIDDGTTYYIQTEFALKNNGGNVEFYQRNNNTNTGVLGPEDAGWSSWNLVATDTSPGALINPGYWGFGVYMHTGSMTSSSRNFDNIRFDDVRIKIDNLGDIGGD